MPDGKNDRVREVDFVRVLVDGRRDNRRVDDDRVIGSHGFTAQLHAGVLRWQVHPDVFVQDERYPNLPCKRMIGKSVESSTSDSQWKNTPHGHKYMDTQHYTYVWLFRTSFQLGINLLLRQPPLLKMLKNLEPGSRICFHSTTSAHSQSHFQLIPKVLVSQTCPNKTYGAFRQQATTT